MKREGKQVNREENQRRRNVECKIDREQKKVGKEDNERK